MKYKLSDLIDIEKNQKLLDSFCDAMGVAAAIIDLDGKVLVGSRWQRICTDFHRVNERACEKCIESDTQLANELQQGKRFSIYQCRNGLTDAASPIIIEGGHIANTFVGQFLLKKPDQELFRRQAAAYGFEETDYLNALFAVPIVNEENLPAILDFLTNFAEMVAKIGLDHIKQMEAEEALRQSEEKYRILVENANDAVFIAQDGVVKFPNRKTEELTGHSAEELARMPFIDFIHPDDRETVMDRHRRRLRGERPASTYSFTIIHKSGLERKAQINTVLIQWEDRPATLNFLRDITKQVEMETRLRQAQKMEAIGTLAGGIAHDFNNILFPLIGYSEMLKLDLPVDSPLHGYVNEIIRAALRSKDLVKQILTFSRQGDQDVKPVKLQPIVKDALKLLRSSIPTIIDILQDIDSDCGVVVADPTQVHQVVMNLATNAYHAMEETGGRLKVNLKQIRLESDQSVFLELTPGEYARLTVTDTGVGIEKDVMDKIFDPYYTTKETGKGTGLGLSVVQGIVKNCNGDIHIDSEPGKRTEIQVYLPIIDRKVDDIRTDRSTPIIGGTEDILLVDDEEIIVKMEQQMLERLGYQVTIRTGSLDALEAFKANPDSFDLVITDMTMPNMTGVQLTKEIKRIRPDIPVILCTGFSYQINDEKSKTLGIQGFVMKPVVMKEIAETIRMVLDKEIVD